MITFNMVAQGYDKGIIRCIDARKYYGDGIAVEIGDNYFYFAGELGEEYTDPKKFETEVGVETIKKMIFDTLEDFKKDETYELEYKYYESYLVEKLMKGNTELKAAKQIANKLTDAINVMGINPEQVATMLTYEHRTLQADLALVCMYFIKKVADDNYCFDARNEGVHRIAKQFINPDYEL